MPAGHPAPSRKPEHFSHRHRLRYVNVAEGVPPDLHRTKIDVLVLHTRTLLVPPRCRIASHDFLRAPRLGPDCAVLKLAHAAGRVRPRRGPRRVAVSLGRPGDLHAIRADYRPLLYPLMHARPDVRLRLHRLHRPERPRPWTRPPAARRPTARWTSSTAAHLPYWFGRQGQLKHRIADIVPRAAGRHGLRCDISTRPEDAITVAPRGSTSSPAPARLVGIESGSSALDARGQVQAFIRWRLARDPDLTFDEVSRLLPPGWDNHRFFALGRATSRRSTPRQCNCSSRDYDGVLHPGRHYLPIRPDYSNLDDVLEQVRDARLLQTIADRAYNEIYLSNRHTYAELSNYIDEIILSHVPKVRGHDFRAPRKLAACISAGLPHTINLAVPLPLARRCHVTNRPGPPAPDSLSAPRPRPAGRPAARSGQTARLPRRRRQHASGQDGRRLAEAEGVGPEAMESVMGPLPGKEKRCPLDVKIDEEVDCGRYVRRSSPTPPSRARRVPAYLLVPKAVLDGKTKAPACCACTGPTTSSATARSSAWRTTPNARATAGSWPSAATSCCATELSAAGEVPARPQEAGLGERHAEGRLGQRPRPRPARVAAVRPAGPIRRHRPLARRAQQRLHGRVRRSAQGRRLELRARLVPRLLRAAKNWHRSWAGARPLHAEAARLQGPLGRTSRSTSTRSIGALAPRHVADRRPAQGTRTSATDSVDKVAAAAAGVPAVRARRRTCGSSTRTAGTSSRRRCASWRTGSLMTC